MIVRKSAAAIAIMQQAGQQLAAVFERIQPMLKPGISSLAIDQAIEQALTTFDMRGESKGYKGYAHVSCISFNDEVVHGIPSSHKICALGDLVKIDVCASWRGYCADMTRSFLIGASPQAQGLVQAAQSALDAGIAQAVVGNRVSDISVAIQKEVEKHGYGVVRDFAGHGIGTQMHEDPEVANFGKPGRGPLLQPGMTLAIEPMITLGHYEVYVANDGWTVKTKDKSLAAHVEDTVLVTHEGPCILTRLVGGSGYEKR